MIKYNGYYQTEEKVYINERTGKHFTSISGYLFTNQNYYLYAHEYSEPGKQISFKKDDFRRIDEQNFKLMDDEIILYHGKKNYSIVTFKIINSDILEFNGVKLIFVPFT